MLVERIISIKSTPISNRKKNKRRIVSLFRSRHRKEMSLIPYATKSLFSPHSMVCIHISKLYSKNHDLGIIIFIRTLLKYLPLSRNFIPKLLIFTGYIYVH